MCVSNGCQWYRKIEMNESKILKATSQRKYFVVGIILHRTGKLLRERDSYVFV